MKNQNDWFQEDPPSGHVDKVMAKVDSFLDLKKAKNQRRWLLFLSPTFAAALVAFILLKKSQNVEPSQVTFLDFVSDMDESDTEHIVDDLAVIEDLELFEDFDDIEALDQERA